MDTEFFCRKIRGLRFLYLGGKEPEKREKIDGEFSFYIIMYRK